MNRRCKHQPADGQRARRFQAIALLALSAAIAASATASCGVRPTDADARPSATPHTPLFNDVDHFFATSPAARELFVFFGEELGLPQAWPFQSYGSFASGAIDLGNTSFEFVQSEVQIGELPQTAFAMLAFEPNGRTPAMVAELDRRGIGHERPDVSTFTRADGRTFGWTNTGLTGLLPEDVAFACDYSERQTDTSDELAENQGGPLGVRALQEIVIGVQDLDAARRAWRKLLDTPAAESDGVFGFGSGPGVRLVPSEELGILRIVLLVRSLENASAFLKEHGLFELIDGEVCLDTTSSRGLHVVLVER